MNYKYRNENYALDFIYLALLDGYWKVAQEMIKNLLETWCLYIERRWGKKMSSLLGGIDNHSSHIVL